MSEATKILKRIENKISRASGLLYEAELLTALNNIHLDDRLGMTSSASVGLLRLVENKRREMERAGK